MKAMALILLHLALLGCDMALFGAGEAPPDIIIGDLQMGRSERDPQRYRLSMQVLNRSNNELTGLTVQGRFNIPLEHESNMEAPVSVAQEIAIGSGTRRLVEFIFESPFPVVPQDAVTMRGIAVGNAVFREDEHTLHHPGYWVQWPWDLRESTQ